MRDPAFTAMMTRPMTHAFVTAEGEITISVANGEFLKTEPSPILKEVGVVSTTVPQNDEDEPVRMGGLKRWIASLKPRRRSGHPW